MHRKRLPGTRFQILALDVDGTLLDREGTLRPSTAAAVARAAAAGIRPVLCTGRRYRRARPIAEQLGIDAPIVCNSGAIVKEPDGDRTLWRADFETPLLAQIVALFREGNEPIVSFTDWPPHEPDFLVEHAQVGRTPFDDYVGQNASHSGIDPGWPERAVSRQAERDQADPWNFPPDGHFHICAIGSRTEMETFEEKVLARLEGQVRTFVQKSPRYMGTMCEIIRADASKWTAVLHLAELWGIPAEAIVAVGDDMNDLPMILGAGLGVAMGHAPETVRAAADLVTGDHDNDGVAMLVDDVLLAG
ncbi:MAG: Cof-type HAD-IIB family hydrolase [Isosphaeraceae bacterium]